MAAPAGRQPGPASATADEAAMASRVHGFGWAGAGGVPRLRTTDTSLPRRRAGCRSPSEGRVWPAAPPRLGFDGLALRALRPTRRLRRGTAGAAAGFPWGVRRSGHA